MEAPALLWWEDHSPYGVASRASQTASSNGNEDIQRFLYSNELEKIRLVTALESTFDRRLVLPH